MAGSASMDSRRLHRLPVIVYLAAFSFCVTGCSTPGKGLNVFAPFRGSTTVEEYRSPPPDDTRYTQAPSYPSQLLKPVVKLKDEESGTGLRRGPIGGGGMMPGNAGGMGY